MLCTYGHVLHANLKHLCPSSTINTFPQIVFACYQLKMDEVKEGSPKNVDEAELVEKTVVDEMKEEQEEEDDEEALPHSEFLDIFEEGLALMVQDPLLCDLPIQVTLEEVNSQVALEYGQAMTVRVCKADGEVMPIVVVQSATVLDLKKAICRYMELKQQREGGVKHISWKYVWRTFHLVFNGEQVEDDKRKLKDYGIRNRDEVTFLKKLRRK
uniref:U11/U12 small nuclear ribonucleoprotein 25 kDa protein-like n=2 Tax=Sinocyclocheilus anshuiensis TaxID=1608454 RepID=A0A671QZR5_9TELE